MSVTLLYPYVTQDDVKRYCGIATATTTFDDNINTAINKASRFVDSRTQRYFYKKTYTSEYLNGTDTYEGWQILGDKILTPQNAPIISVTTLIENDTTLTENTDFYVDKASGMIEKMGGNWDKDARAICITCELGYDSTDTATPSDNIPGDVAQYALELAARFSGQYKKTIKNYVSGAAESVDLYGVPKEIDAELIKLRPINVL